MNSTKSTDTTVVVFPKSPEIGDIYESDDRTFEWNGFAWRPIAPLVLVEFDAGRHKNTRH